MPRLHLLVSGRVQGVGYRWFARLTARRLQLSGWVRNLPDGTVEIAVDGSEDGLAQFRAEMQSGPAGAVVSEVRDLEPVTGELEYPFSMRK
jgi:acylphosphatase